MEKIAKSHDKFREMKDMTKASQYPDITVSDDLQVLRIAYDYKLEIPLLLYDYEAEYKDTTKELLDQLISVAREAYEISHSSYLSLASKESHAGIVAAVRLKKYSTEDFKDMDFVLVLDHLEIPGNVGTIYRTCDSCKCQGIILTDAITKPNNEKITSSSRGCNLIIPTLSLSYEETRKFLEEYKFTPYLGEPVLGSDYQSYDYKDKTAIIVGNERFGINPDWYNHDAKKVFIPMEGNQNSLNVGVAASILAYEVYMKKIYRH